MEAKQAKEMTTRRAVAATGSDPAAAVVAAAARPSTSPATCRARDEGGDDPDVT